MLSSINYKDKISYKEFLERLPRETRESFLENRKRHFDSRPEEVIIKTELFKQKFQISDFLFKGFNWSLAKKDIYEDKWAYSYFVNFKVHLYHTCPFTGIVRGITMSMLDYILRAPTIKRFISNLENEGIFVSSLDVLETSITWN